MSEYAIHKTLEGRIASLANELGNAQPQVADKETQKQALDACLRQQIAENIAVHEDREAELTNQVDS